MPLYEYQCNKCGLRFERIQLFSDPLVEKCPDCGGRVEQLISAPAVQFKGSGWYVTDYARKRPGASSGGTESGGKSESGKESAKESADTKDKKPKAETAAKKADTK